LEKDIANIFIILAFSLQRSYDRGMECWSQRPADYWILAPALGALQAIELFPSSKLVNPTLDLVDLHPRRLSRYHHCIASHT
jgi:hypothetical protein